MVITFRKKKQVLTLTALILAAVMLLGNIPTRVQAASSSEIRQQINALKEEKAELQEQIDALQAQYQANENELLDMIAQKDLIDQEIAILHEQIDNINDQLSSFRLLIADKQDELDEASVRLAELSQQNRERIRAMEEEGSLSYWEVIFEANSFLDLLDRINMVNEIAESDRRRLEELRWASEIVSAVQTDLSVEKEELEQTRAELDEAQALLESKRAEADELLVKLIAKGEEYEAMLDESEALQDELMQEIAKKEDEYDEAKYQEWLATYVPPTTYPSDDVTPSTQAPSSSGWVRPLPSFHVTSPFGMRLHPVLGYYRMHNGVDLAATQGTPIYAAKSGQVTVASYQAGGAGYYVSINHGDGFSSIYMHMTRYIVSAGQYVNAGQVIGYVGSTGVSTGPHLHFGISYNGSYVNPLAYVS